MFVNSNPVASDARNPGLPGRIYSLSDIPSELEPAPVAIFIKTFARDLRLAQRLMRSIEEHNRDRIPTFLVCEPELFDEFEFLCSNTTLISEEIFSEVLFTGTVDTLHSKIAAGYLNQQLIKLEFGSLNLVQNYFITDSDLVFIRDFFIGDFLVDEFGTQVFHACEEDRQLSSRGDYSITWDERQKSLSRIASAIGITDIDGFYPTVHNSQLMSVRVLTDLKEFLKSRNMDFRDALVISPYEFSWYSLYALKFHSQTLKTRENFVFMLHSSLQHVEAFITGRSFKTLAPGYLGVIVNSNISSWNGAETLDSWGRQILTWRELGRLWRASIRLTIRKTSLFWLVRRTRSFLKRKCEVQDT